MPKRLRPQSRSHTRGRFVLFGLVGIVALIGFFVARGLQTGTGLFASLAQPTQVNKISTGEPALDCEIAGGLWNPTTKKCTGAIRELPKQPGRVNPENKPKKKADEDIPKPPQPNAPAIPAIQTSSTCPGLVPVKVGQTVATGCGFENGKVAQPCTKNTAQRECKTCGANGLYSNSRACDEAVKVDPTTTVLPIYAGWQFTGGTAEKPNLIPKACIDSSSANVGNTPSGTKNSKGEYCFNGEWIAVDDPTKTGDQQQATILTRSREFCTDPSKPEWNIQTGQCGAHIPTQEELNQELLAKINAETAICTRKGRQFDALGLPCGCKLDEIKQNGKCVSKDVKPVACSVAGKGAGGCKPDETCVSVQYGYKFCQATNTISPAIKNGKPLISYCENNVFSTWNQDTGSYGKTYCQYGCVETKCYDKPTAEINYSSQLSCETNLSNSDKCEPVTVGPKTVYVRLPKSPAEVTNNPQDAAVNKPEKLKTQLAPDTNLETNKNDTKCTNNTLMTYSISPKPGKWVFKESCKNGCSPDGKSCNDDQITPPTKTEARKLPGANITDDSKNCEFGGALVAQGQYRCYCDATHIEFTDCSGSDNPTSAALTAPLVEEAYAPWIDTDSSKSIVSSRNACPGSGLPEGPSTINGEVVYKCKSPSGNYISPSTGLALDGSPCRGNNDVCDSGYCRKRLSWVLGIDWLAADQCAPKPSTLKSATPTELDLAPIK